MIGDSLVAVGISAMIASLVVFMFGGLVTIIGLILVYGGKLK